MVIVSHDRDFVEELRPDRVLLMPEGIDMVTLEHGYRALVEPCRAAGYRLGLRQHIQLFGHTPGT